MLPWRVWRKLSSKRCMHNLNLFFLQPFVYLRPRAANVGSGKPMQYTVSSGFSYSVDCLRFAILTTPSISSLKWWRLPNSHCWKTSERPLAIVGKNWDLYLAPDQACWPSSKAGEAWWVYERSSEPCLRYSSTVYAFTDHIQYWPHISTTYVLYHIPTTYGPHTGHILTTHLPHRYCTRKSVSSLSNPLIIFSEDWITNHLVHYYHTKVWWVIEVQLYRTKKKEAKSQLIPAL